MKTQKTTFGELENEARFIYNDELWEKDAHDLDIIMENAVSLDENKDFNVGAYFEDGDVVKEVIE